MAGILLEDDFQLENHHTLQISLRLRGGKIFIIYVPEKDITIKFKGNNLERKQYVKYLRILLINSQGKNISKKLTTK